MQVYIFKTNIPDQDMAAQLAPVFEQHTNILHWTIDTDDIDKVLRIEAHDLLSESELMQDIHRSGYSCTVMDY